MFEQCYFHNLECVWQLFWEVFLVFLTLENFYFSSIRKVRNTSENHCQIHSKSVFGSDFYEVFLVFLTFKIFYLSSIKDARNIS